jgi:hypothetical protein
MYDFSTYFSQKTLSNQKVWFNFPRESRSTSCRIPTAYGRKEIFMLPSVVDDNSLMEQKQVSQCPQNEQFMEIKGKSERRWLPAICEKENSSVIGFPQFARRKFQVSSASRNLREGNFKRHRLPAICGKEISSVTGFPQFAARKIQVAARKNEMINIINILNINNLK